MKKVVFILTVIAATMTSCDSTPSAYSDNGKLPYDVVTELSDSSNLATVYFFDDKTLYLKSGNSIYKTILVSESDLDCAPTGEIFLLLFMTFLGGLLMVLLYSINNKSK